MGHMSQPETLEAVVPEASTVTEEPAAVQPAHVDIEREKLDFEKAKLDLERDKHKLEERKLFWVAVPAIFAFFISIFSVAFNVKMQNDLAIASFKQKTAEIVMNSNSPVAVRNRTRALAALFPDQLPPNFAEKFQPERYGILKYTEDLKETKEAKKELLKLILDHPDQKGRVVALWTRLFPEDDWANLITNPGHKVNKGSQAVAGFADTGYDSADFLGVDTLGIVLVVLILALAVTGMVWIAISVFKFVKRRRRPNPTSRG